MALPQITVPTGTPAVLANGHTIAEASVYARAAMGQEDRARRC